MSGPRAPHSLRHEPQTTPLKFEEPAIYQLRNNGTFVCCPIQMRHQLTAPKARCQECP
jgi:hypothetical protein